MLYKKSNSHVVLEDHVEQKEELLSFSIIYIYVFPYQRPVGVSGTFCDVSFVNAENWNCVSLSNYIYLFILAFDRETTII